ncbi:hypothetical protein BB558_004878 [Smittium angustum]|uniref:MIR domain-containing protein n=1 Tax=Smittium angustum TaxID=133377 RepID=A0A2U1J221_SMIAN|nr:hypothetical protein BB558_004878 [Smittium angustum]
MSPGYNGSPSPGPGYRPQGPPSQQQFPPNPNQRPGMPSGYNGPPGAGPGNRPQGPPSTQQFPPNPNQRPGVPSGYNGPPGSGPGYRPQGPPSGIPQPSMYGTPPPHQDYGRPPSGPGQIHQPQGYNSPAQSGSPIPLSSVNSTGPEGQKGKDDPDPKRSSENSPTPREYPLLRQGQYDTDIKFGTVIALKHNMTGRFLHSSRNKMTESGSDQELVYCHRWNIGENDWWQVLPANHDVPAPGSAVAYGTQIRLRHLSTKHHLHSHYRFHCPRSGQNEVTCFGDPSYSDENDHWIIERWGDGSYGRTWNANDVVVLRHYVSGMTLHSHDILFSEDVQSVTCFGPGTEENDKWRVKLTENQD